MTAGDFFSPTRPSLFLVDGGQCWSVEEYLERAARVAAQLGVSAAPVINLCEQRAAFLVAYMAAVLSARTTLLPSSRAAEAVAAVAAEYPGSVVVDDALVAAATADRGSELSAAPLATEVDADFVAMIGFTSGSTGVPTRHAKRWGTVAASTVHNAAALRAAIPPELSGKQPWVVGTVPSQHMYGMELTVLVPLLDGMGIHAGRPLLPEEVAAALAEVPEPRVLVSTPAHLRVIVASGVVLPKTAVVACATAPLDAELAAQIEAATGGILVEMFGSTETCILAHRRTAQERWWTPYTGVELHPESEHTRVSAPWFLQDERLLDLVERDDRGRFSLLGRSADLVDVAGKRASLGDLNQRLLRIPGVVDGVIFQPEQSRGLVRRLAAMVVAPGVTAEQVREALAPAMDPVFLPRPLLLVPSLPRTAAGKLPRAALEAALADLLSAGAAKRGLADA